MRERSVPAQRSEEPPAAPGHRELSTHTLPYLRSIVLRLRRTFGSLRDQRLDLLHELADVLELTVHGGKSHIGDGVHPEQLGHPRPPTRTARHPLLAAC